MFRELLILLSACGLSRAQEAAPSSGFVVDPEFGVYDENQCASDRDCPPYNTCLYSPFTQPRCVPPLFRDEIDCKGMGPDGSFPDHEICVRTEIQKDDTSNALLGTSRCFLKGDDEYRCGTAFKNTCTPTHTKDGALLEAEGCPYKFACVEAEFILGKLKVCMPQKFASDAGSSETCVTAFDCGYSQLQDKWVECLGGSCQNVVQ